jgi:hypothetical protein
VNISAIIQRCKNKQGSWRVKNRLVLLLIVLSFIDCATAFAASKIEFVDEPNGCLDQLKKTTVAMISPCAVRSLKKGFAIEWSKSKITIGNKNSIVFYDRSHLRLLSGTFWFQSSSENSASPEKLFVDSGFAQFEVQGEAWFEKESGDKVVVRNLGGEVSAVGPAPLIRQTIAVGFENWFSGLNSSNQVDQGFVRPIQASEFLPHWIRFSCLSKSEVVQALAAYKQAWAPAVNESAQLNQEIITRHIASVEATKLEKQQRAKAQAKKEQEFRRMFRERYFSQSGMTATTGE